MHQRPQQDGGQEKTCSSTHILASSPGPLHMAYLCKWASLGLRACLQHAHFLLQASWPQNTHAVHATLVQPSRCTR